MPQAHHPHPVSNLQLRSTADGMDSSARVGDPIMMRRRPLYEAVALAIAMGAAASAFVPYRLAEAGAAAPLNSVYLSNGAYDTTGSFTNDGWIGIGYGSYDAEAGTGTLPIDPTPGSISPGFGGYGNAYGTPGLGGYDATLTNNAPYTLTNTGAAYVSEYGSLINDGNVQNDGYLGNYGTVDNASTGTLSNAGYLFSDGDLTNTGTLDNLGDLVSSGALDTAGILNNAGYLYNAGTLTNAESLTDESGTLSGAGVINNSSSDTLFNYGDLGNFGTLNNGDGTLANAGALVNDGYLVNAAQVADVDRSASGAGLINNAAYSSLTNYGLMANFGTLSNSGSLDNYEGFIYNAAEASYEEGYGSTYEISGAGLLHNQTGGNLTNQGIIWNSGGYVLSDGGYSVSVEAGTIRNDGSLTSDGLLINGSSYSAGLGMTGAADVAGGPSGAGLSGGLSPKDAGGAAPAVIDNYGTLTNKAYGDLFNAGGVINNQADGILDNDGFLLNTYAKYSEPSGEPGVINNAGTLSNTGYLGNYGGIVNNTGAGVINNSGYLYNAPSGLIPTDSMSNAAGLAPTTTTTDGGVINNDATLDNSGYLGNYGQINNQANGVLRNSRELYNAGEIRNSGLFEITDTGEVIGGGAFIQESAGGGPTSTGAGPLNNGGVPETVVNGLLEAGTISIDAGRLSGDGGRIGLDGSFDPAAIASDFGPNIPSIGDAIGIGADATVDAEDMANGQIGTLTFESAVQFEGTLMVDMVGFESGELDFYEVLDTITFGTGSQVIFDDLSFLTEPGTYEVSFIDADDILGFDNLGATFLGLPDWADADLLFVDNNASIRLRVTEGQQQIPLPTPLWLLLPGLGALGLARRRCGRSG